MWFIISLLIGAGAGALLGYFGQCSSGACPLTANPGRGALVGAFMGLLIYMGLGANSVSATPKAKNIKEIAEGDFDREVKQSATPVVVDFFATWCGPCKVLSPRLDEVAGAFTNQVKVVKVDVDQSPGLAREYAIEGVPTLLVFQDGKVTGRIVGVPQTTTLRAQFESLASGPAALEQPAE